MVEYLEIAQEYINIGLDWVTSPVGIFITYVVGSVIIFIVFLLILRKLVHIWMSKLDVFQMKTLLLRVPKEDMKKDGDGMPSQRRETVHQRISMSDVLYATLGGLKAQRGILTWWLGRNDHFSFELVADKDQLITFYAIIPQYLQRYFEQQFQAQYDDSVIDEVQDYNIFDPDNTVMGAQLFLKKRDIFPIVTYEKMENDPLNALTNAMSKFEKFEGAAIQYIIRSAHPRWHTNPNRVAAKMHQGKKLVQAMYEVYGNPIFRAWSFFRRVILQYKRKSEKGIDLVTEREYRLSPQEEEIVKALEDKSSQAGFDVNIRAIVSTRSREIAEFKLQSILNAFTQYASYEFLNAFTYPHFRTDTKFIDNFIYRRFEEKNSFIMGTKEMTSLFHMPISTTDTPNIRWLLSKKAAPPFNMPKEGVLLGEVFYRGISIPVRMKKDDRRRHIYVIGQTGSGKSVLLSSLAIQDIQNGEGVGIIDPHGDLVEDVLMHVPKERADDVVIFAPGDIDRPVGLNMLEADSEQMRDFAVQEMVAIFYKLFGKDVIGPMFEHYMRNAMLALMEDEESGATLIEIPRMFTDATFRRQKLKKVTNLIVKNFWQQEYEQSQAGQQAADMLSYVISKIGRFLTNDMMRNIVGQHRSGFNVRDIMDNQKILLVNLSKGKVGEVNSNLLGLILVSKIQMAAMARADMPKEQRKDFYLYIDEFQNYTTDSIAVILSEARKYKLDMILAHQYISQLVKEQDTSIRDAVFGNAGTKVAFRIGVEDAETMAKEFAPIFDENDVINVEKFTANIKLLIENTASRPFNMRTIMPTAGNLELATKLKQLSRLKFGRDRAIVDGEIRERGQLEKLAGGDSNLSNPDSFF
ncbi:MAG: type IV secretion system DNA-binding domain-containing protein [Patescibacteria group bacterium]